jgi:hypothetical protein
MLYLSKLSPLLLFPLCIVTSSVLAEIKIEAGSSAMEQLAARELNRYLYLRTGVLPASLPQNGRIIVGSKDSPLLENELRAEADQLKSQEFLIKTKSEGGKKTWWIIGGDDLGALYGSYRFLEQLGIRFYLHQDVVPAASSEMVIPDIKETGKPLFELRGLNPWGGHAEGIDTWSTDQFKAVMSQMVKMRMNVIKIHSYPASGPSEPGVWAGLPEDVKENGDVTFSPTASFWHTSVKKWGYKPRKTSEYRFGGSLLFETDEWGAPVMEGSPMPNTVENRNELFNRTGKFWNEVFGFAKTMGIKTALGTEIGIRDAFPLMNTLKPGERLDLHKHGPVSLIGKELSEHIREKGKDPAAPAVLEEIYTGLFRRISSTHPLDYYVLYVPERWYWRYVFPQMFEILVKEWKIALKAFEKENPPFQLASSGWQIGPDFDHTAFDRALPKNIAITEMSGAYDAPVDPAFGKMQGRPKWAIPWIEEDSAMLTPALWTGRVRKDAADALAYGCTGLLTLHWRTLINEPAADALSKATWSQEGWNPEFGKTNPQPPKSTFHVEGPISPEINQLTIGYQNQLTPSTTIPEDQPIKDAKTTGSPGVYRSAWVGLTRYWLQVPNGTYQVTLKFAEPDFDRSGERIFDVSVQEKKMIEGLDLAERTGRYSALDVNIKPVEVKDGWMQIDFDAKAGKSLLSGIEIKGKDYERLINCGGPDIENFKGDKTMWLPTKNFLWGKYTWGYAGQFHEQRGLPSDDHYQDWALANFGKSVGPKAAEIFTALDGRMPIPSSWAGFAGDGAGGLMPDPRPWDLVSKEYAFVNEFEALRPKVEGSDNLERFDFWLNQFRYTRATARACCTWGQLDAVLKQMREEKDKEKQKTIAETKALPLLIELVAQVKEAYQLLLATITEIGGMQTVLNWEGHNQLLGIETHGQEIAAILGTELPPAAIPAKEYQGESRLIVPTVRSVLEPDEPLRLKSIVLDNAAPKSLRLFWRPLGKGEFQAIEAKPLGRGVYEFELTSPNEDFEYRIEAETQAGKKLRWPITAPERNQTVVTLTSAK